MTDQVLQVEVVAHVLGSMDHCAQCQVFIDGVGVGQQIHRTDLASYPPDWMQEWQRLSDLILDLAAHYPGRLQIKITDAQTPHGLWLALRHGVRRYPTFLVAGEKYHGFEQSRVEELISRHL